jgi:hypothetical protein
MRLRMGALMSLDHWDIRYLSKEKGNHQMSEKDDDAKAELWALYWRLPASQQLACALFAVTIFSAGFSAAYFWRSSEIAILKEKAELRTPVPNPSELPEAFTKNDGGKAPDTSSETEKKVLYKLTADRFAEALNLSEGKTNPKAPIASQSEEYYLRLKLAVFENMYILDANEILLKRTIAELDARGHSWVGQFEQRILGEFQTIRKSRLRWLSDTVVPALEEASKKPRPQHPGQHGVSIPIQYPDLFQPPKATFPRTQIMVVDTIPSLNDEIELIKRSL